MATNVTPGIPNARKQEAVAAICPPGSTYKCALIKAGATVDIIATYAALGSNEVVAGGGYTTGGQTLTGYTADLTDNVAFVDWANPIWDPATFSADGAVIYDTGSGKVVGVIDFGSTRTADGGPFEVEMPASGVGLVRMA